MDQRSELGARIERVADADVARPLGDRSDDAVVERPLHEQARAGRAALSVEREDLRERRVDRELRVGVLEDDHRRLAAELHRDALERRRTGRGDQPAGRSSRR